MTDADADPATGLDPFAASLDYPMFIVTAVHPATGARAGCLIGFATQASIDPERFLVCLSRTNQTHRIALNADVLAVHAPRSDQRELAALFGTETGDETDKFTRCAWAPGPGGLPLLEACPQRIVGRIREQFTLGDHTGFLLDPLPLDPPEPSGSKVAGAATAPLMFSTVRHLEAGHGA